MLPILSTLSAAASTVDWAMIAGCVGKIVLAVLTAVVG